jgi:hypothetical protein
MPQHPMTNLAHLLGLAPGGSALFLGPPGQALEAALARSVGGGRLSRSSDGRGLPARAFEAVVIGAESAAGEPRLADLVGAAAHAVTARGTVALELPNRFPVLAPMLFAYEGLPAPPAAGGRPGGPGLRAVKGLCRAAGLTRVACYLSLPDLADPRLLLPLDSPPAAAFHFRPPFFPETFRRRALRGALGGLAAGGGLPAASPAFTLLASPAETA